MRADWPQYAPRRRATNTDIRNAPAPVVCDPVAFGDFPHFFRSAEQARVFACREIAMASGLAALLDDVAGIAKMAAASLDDVVGAASKASSKAVGVVIDDTAVSPRYVVGFSPDRELPIIARIAIGSLRNKLLRFGEPSIPRRSAHRLRDRRDCASKPSVRGVLVERRGPSHDHSNGL
jgi:hypothetical protein